MIKSRHDIVVSNAVLVLKALIQNQLLGSSAPAPSSQSPFAIISLLARRIDDIKHPQARACVLWLVGQYGAAPGRSTVIEGIADWAPDVLRKFCKSFSTEESLVKLQVLTLAAKLFLLCPMNPVLDLLCHHVLALGRYDLNYDVRDRTRMLNSLLAGVSPTISGSETEEQSGVVLRREQVMKVLFDGKAGIVEESEEAFGHHYLPIGSLGIVTGKATLGDSVLPEWLEGGIDASLRQNEEDMLPAAPPPQAISSAGFAAPKALGSAGVIPVVLTPTGSSTPVREAKENWRDLDKFYASDNEKKESESSSEEESEDNWEEEEPHNNEDSEDDGVYDESSDEDGQDGTDESSAKRQQ